MSDQSLTTVELCEWLANPQWTNGRLNQEDAIVHMMLAADTIATKDARIAELEAALSAAKAIIAEYAGINPVQDWREAIKIVQKARAFMKTDAQILNEFVNNNDPETMRARIAELEAELVFVRGQLEVALGTIKIQRCSVDAILSAVGDDPRVAKLRDCLVEKTSAPPPAQSETERA